MNQTFSGYLEKLRHLKAKNQTIIEVIYTVSAVTFSHLSESTGYTALLTLLRPLSGSGQCGGLCKSDDS